MKNSFIYKNKIIIVLGFACLLGVALLLYAYAPWGIGVEYDGFIYLTGARNILEGNGFSFWDSQGNTNPITHFPPLYSSLIAGITWITKLRPAQSAEILNIFSLAALIYLSGYLVYKYSGSVLLAGFTAVFVAISDSIFMINQWALTESLFLVLLLLSLFLLNEYLSSEKSIVLIMAGLVAGLSYLARYVGLSVIGFGGLVLLLNREQVFKTRIKNALFYGLASALIVSPALIRNLILSGEITSRNLVFHPIPMYELRLALVRLSWWLMLDKVPQNYGFAGICIFIFTVSLLWVWWRYFSNKDKKKKTTTVQSQKLLGLLIGFILIYVIFILTSLTFFDASTPLTNRIFSPIYIVGLLFLLLLAWSGIKYFGKSILMIGGILILSFVMVNIFSRTWFSVNQMRKNGLGFNARSWQESSSLAWLKEQAEEIKIYSNESFPISFLTGQYIYPVPEGKNPVDNIRVAGYFEKIEEMHQVLKDEAAYLLIFDTIEAHPDYYTVDELAAGLNLLLETEDGIIFFHPDNQIVSVE